MTETKQMDPAELAQFCAKALEDKLAEKVTILKLDAESSIADYFVVATANSEPHLRSLASYVERQVREAHKLRPFSEAGESASGWMLIDFVSVVVHVMTAETRDRYSLESLWGMTPAPQAIKQLEEMTAR